MNSSPDLRFAPVSPEVLARHAAAIPQCLDATAGDPAYPDALDEAVVAAVAGAAAAAAAGDSAQPDVLGLWRAWGYPGPDGDGGVPRRFYLVAGSAGSEAVLPEDADVVVFEDYDSLPAWQRQAVSHGALLWAATPPAEVTMARAFDRVDPVHGPLFEADHPRIADAGERDRLLARLDAGYPLLMTLAVGDDVVDRTRVGEVPMGFRTDGVWIWVDAVSYYLREHQLSPEPRLLAHLARAGSSAGSSAESGLDAVAVFRAALRLVRPAVAA